MTVFKPLPPPLPPTMLGSLQDAVTYLRYIFEYLRRIYDVIRGVQIGKLQCTTTVTLTASATTTTLTDARIGAESVILFMPTTANAAGAMTNLYVSARAQGSATLTHSSTATTDRVFGVIVIG